MISYVSKSMIYGSFSVFLIIYDQMYNSQTQISQSAVADKALSE